jgi:hypothetical protein
MKNADDSGQASDPPLSPDLRRMEADALEMLASGVDENDILLEVCGRTGWTWAKAEDFLRRLATDRRQELARRRLPLALVVSLAALAAGAVLLGACFFGLRDVAVAAWHARRLEDFSQALALLLLQVPALELAILGTAMITGGAIGLVSASSDLGRDA